MVNLVCPDCGVKLTTCARCLTELRCYDCDPDYCGECEQRRWGWC